MEGNKDEAIRCKELAQKAIKKNDFQEAIRLLDKSNRMYPCEETQNLLEFCKKKKLNKSSSASSRSASPSPQFNTSNFSSHNNNEKSAFNPNDFHNDKNNSVNEKINNAHNRDNLNDNVNANSKKTCFLSKKILSTSDYYQILNIERNATDEQIKKSFRKLALQLHPDKNKFPEAEEAFKKVAKAFQCLTNPEKRRLYDQYGSENDPQHRRAEYDADVMTAEELFQAFFGVDISADGNRRVFRHVRRQQNNEQQQRFYTVIQILPIFLLLFITFLSNIFQNSPKPSYSFDFSTDYPVSRVTRWNHVEYFVAKDFYSNFSKDSVKLRELEVSIELSYFQKECAKEEQEMLRQIQMARYYGSVEQIRAVQQKDRPFCRKLQQLRVNGIYYV